MLNHFTKHLAILSFVAVCFTLSSGCRKTNSVTESSNAQHVDQSQKEQSPSQSTAAKNASNFSGPASMEPETTELFGSFKSPDELVKKSLERKKFMKDWVEVSGPVSMIGEKKNINLGTKDNPRKVIGREVYLKFTDPMWKDADKTLLCFVKDQDIGGKIVLGQTIKIKGICYGQMGIAHIRDAEIIEIAPFESIRLLAADYADRVSKMQRPDMVKEFGGKSIILTGKVKRKETRARTQTTRNNSNVSVVVLNAGSSEILCELFPSDKDFADSSAVGSEVSLSCKFHTYGDGTGPLSLEDCIPVKSSR